MNQIAEQDVSIPAESVRLHGTFASPPEAEGLVIFAHGSGSSRFSPRNRFVARVLQEARLATLLMDLLTFDEELEDAHTGALRFDIFFLAKRLVSAAKWAAGNSQTKNLRVGYFGASTGAAAALIAAAEKPEAIGAVVSRGGRPDLAGELLAKVQAPTLLIVGGYDYAVLPLNDAALEQLHCEKELAIVPKATHLFEEPGALEQVAELATYWFKRHLVLETALSD